MTRSLVQAVLALALAASVAAEAVREVTVVTRKNDGLTEVRGALLDHNPYQLVLGLLGRPGGEYGLRMTLPAEQIVSVDDQPFASVPWQAPAGRHALLARLVERKESDEVSSSQVHHEVLSGSIAVTHVGMSVTAADDSERLVLWNEIEGIDGGSPEAFLWGRVDPRGALLRPISAFAAPLGHLLERRIALALVADRFSAALALSLAVVGGAALGGALVARLRRQPLGFLDALVVVAVLVGVALGTAMPAGMGVSGTIVLEVPWALALVYAAQWSTSARARVRGWRGAAMALGILLASALTMTVIFVVAQPILTRMLVR